MAAAREPRTSEPAIEAPNPVESELPPEVMPAVRDDKPTRKRKALLAVGVPITVAAAVLLVLAGFGILPISPKSPSAAKPLAGSTYWQARDSSQRVGSGFEGGSWSIIEAFGVATSTDVQVSDSELESGFAFNGCSLSLTSSAPNSFTLPASSGLTTGNYSFWLFVFKNLPGTSLLVVGDLGGSAAAWGMLGGGQFGPGGCLGASGTSFLTPVASNVSDSPTVATAANAAGGLAFLNAHSGITAGLSVFGGTTSAPASTWTATYSACSDSSASGSTSAPVFRAVFNGTTSAVLQSSTQTVTCYGIWS